jgi:hypothetical protein
MIFSRAAPNNRGARIYKLLIWGHPLPGLSRLDIVTIPLQWPIRIHPVLSIDDCSSSFTRDEATLLGQVPISSLAILTRIPPLAPLREPPTSLTSTLGYYSRVIPVVVRA